MGFRSGRACGSNAETGQRVDKNSGLVTERNRAIFEALTDKLGAVFSKITSRGVLNEKDIDEAMREIRVALLEADVSLPVAKSFIAQVKEQALGEKVVKSVSPGQMVVKIVHDELVKLLGDESCELNFRAVPPVCVLMVGLQGSGKHYACRDQGCGRHGHGADADPDSGGRDGSQADH